MSLFIFRGRNIALYEDKTTFLKGDFTMLEMVVFALVLVISQFVGGYIMMKVIMHQFMNKDFIKKYAKMGIEASMEIQEEMEDEF